MFHGFGVSRFFWTAPVHAVADAGYYAVAPNQRGYAAVARPEPVDHAGCRMDRRIGDALDIVTAVGHAFHLVSHDCGASLAWQIADQHPNRSALLAIPSRIHPLAFDGEQRRRSGHHRTFLEPDAGPNILADNANWLRTCLTKNGVLPAAIERVGMPSSIAFRVHEADIEAKAPVLAEFIEASCGRYRFAGRPIAVGFSNGAIMTAAVLLTHPGLLAEAILLRPLSPFSHDPPHRLDRGDPSCAACRPFDHRRRQADRQRVACYHPIGEMRRISLTDERG
jgi:pimeloyl-ACP methyl ester carboxylesterase